MIAQITPSVIFAQITPSVIFAQITPSVIFAQITPSVIFIFHLLSQQVITYFFHRSNKTVAVLIQHVGLRPILYIDIPRE